MKKLVYRLQHSISSTKLFTFFILPIAYCLLSTSCSVTKQISKQAKNTLLKDSAVRTGHIGISIYDPATNKYIYNHNATQYFIPASNTKLFTLYAGMKYLGDSLIGGYYQNRSDTAINFIATGDPTFLHPNFKTQPVLDFFKKEKRKIYVHGSYNDEALGYGWAWDDYNEDYMAERNIFPVYGNVVEIKIRNSRFETTPTYFESLLPNNEYIDSNIWIDRVRTSNKFIISKSKRKYTGNVFPFASNKNETTIELLNIDFALQLKDSSDTNSFQRHGLVIYKEPIHPIKTQPSDSLFKLMMHRSDNFFAEQTLIMVSKRGWNNLAEKNETLVVTDTVLKLHLPKLAQRPKWVDGSGLSRYNLFTPQSFVQILNQLQIEFGLKRLQTILPTGGTGTLSSYFKKYAGSIFAKTGTLSNNCALSGYLITNKGKLLIFSVLNNNYITGATPVRKAVERFLENVINTY